MSAPRLNIIGASLAPIDRAAGTWGLAGHLVVGTQCRGPIALTLHDFHFEPLPGKARRGRKHDDAQRIAVHLAYAVSKRLDKTESARRIRTANMVLMGTASAPENQERSVRRKLAEPRLKALLASVGKNGGGVAFVVAHDGRGHAGFLIERDMPAGPMGFPDSLGGLAGWFWQEGMRAAEYGTLRIKAKQP